MCVLGYYAGFVASSMMVGRILSSIPWGRVADTHGRKPVICLSSLSIAVFSLCFGLSTSFQWAVGARLLLGLGNPIIGIARTVVSEICCKEHEALGMSSITGDMIILVMMMMMMV